MYYNNLKCHLIKKVIKTIYSILLLIVYKHLKTTFNHYYTLVPIEPKRGKKADRKLLPMLYNFRKKTFKREA